MFALIRLLNYNIYNYFNRDVLIELETNLMILLRLLEYTSQVSLCNQATKKGQEIRPEKSLVP